MTLMDELAILHSELYEEWLELATDEYSDWWQFYRNEEFGMYNEGAD